MPKERKKKHSAGSETLGFSVDTPSLVGHKTEDLDGWVQFVVIKVSTMRPFNKLG